MVSGRLNRAHSEEAYAEGMEARWVTLLEAGALALGFVAECFAGTAEETGGLVISTEVVVGAAPMMKDPLLA